MAKITVYKTVYWDAGGREMTGKVKQLYSDYAVIKAADCEYIVKKSALSLRSAKTAKKDI
jgi:hypothetical protein